jgi:ribonucleoside-diphosphate reductase alpha chain
LARTYSYGGGCGINISNLRPSGATVNNAAKTTSGPVSFMDLYSSVTGVIGQSGRRGALMIMMDVNHPDIFDFVDAKKNTDKVNFANISVKVNDNFMRAVENNEDYFLC